MTFIPAINGTISTKNSNTTLNAVEWNAYSGTVVSATVNTFVLDSGATGDYTGQVIEILSGTGANQFYAISSYAVGTFTCTFD